MEWRTTLFVVILVPIMVSLGFWQLARSEEKAALAVEFSRKQAQAPVELNELWQDSPNALAYLPVTLNGKFVNGENFLLDNRILAGKYGNEAVGVFQLNSGELVLVNRGWLPADSARRSFPDIPPVSGPITLTGHIYVPPGEPYLLGEQQLPEGWPKLVQAVDANLFRQSLEGESLFPYSVRIDAGQPGALAVNWQVINISPEKHIGYALQWFTMAAVLAIFYLLHSTNLWQVIRGKRVTEQ